MDKVIVELSDGSVLLYDCPDIPTLDAFERKYQYNYTSWKKDFLEHHFVERRCRY